MEVVLIRTCKLCQRSDCREVLNLGPQPLCNRFKKSPEDTEYRHPLEIGVCCHCGTVQLGEPVPVEEMRPQVDWITYNEPESHLNHLADILANLSGMSQDATIGGLSYKDESTLRRLRERGFLSTWLADPQKDFGISAPGAGVESLQAKLTPEGISELIARHGRSDMVVLRHVLEHSHNLGAVLGSLRALLKPEGYLVLEMPDATRALEKLDYSTIWEEHLLYFTPATLKNCMALAGFDLIHYCSYPYTLEDSLVAIVKPGKGLQNPILGRAELDRELVRARRFLDQFSRQKEKYQAFFQDQKRSRGGIALLGAGHLSISLINFLDLAPWIDFVIDDHPKKKGMFMPGSGLPILGSEALVDGRVGLCCMSVRPEIEESVVNKNQRFLARGGVMVSIFPESRYAWDLAA